MRPIKYLAWHKKQHKMAEVLRLSLDQGEVIGAEVDYGDCMSETWFGNDIVVREFTGLHDKNGREIYEGDILRCKHFVDPLRKQHYLTHSVEWCGKIAGWRARNSEGGDDGSPALWTYLKTSDSPEVVGNVHESPEPLDD